jgi:polyhydroxyalkanoate synthesis regulator phasin
MAEWTEQLTQLMRESVNASVETAVKFQQQTWRMVDELVQRGAVEKDEGKQLLDMWTHQTEAFQKRMEEKYRQWEESLKAGLRGYVPPNRKDLDELHHKLDQLIQNLQAVTRTQPRKRRAGAKAKKPKARAARKKR